MLGARFFGTAYDEPNIICADMGGTTFDVALIERGAYILEDEPVIDRYTCLIPKVAVESIGAGGGSLVWIDDNGCCGSGHKARCRSRTRLLRPRGNVPDHYRRQS